MTWLVVALFRELARTGQGTELDRRIRIKARPRDHAAIRQAVERLLYSDD